MMAARKGTKVGVDAYFREICVGDEIRDADGIAYTVDQFGRAKPLTHGNSVPLSRLKEISLIKAWTPHEDPKPAPAPTSPVPEPTFDPAPVEPAKETPKDPAPQAEELRPVNSPRRVKTGGKPNTTGHSQLCAFAQRHFVPAKVARQILLDHGIPVYTRGKNTKTHFPSERIEEVRKLLDDWAAAHPEMHKDKVVHTRLSYIARKAGITMRELHRRCLIAGIPVISDPAYNKSVHPQDALRVLALAKGEPMPIVAIEPAEVEVPAPAPVKTIKEFTNDEIMQEAQDRGLIPAVATTAQVVTKDIALTILTDQDLADALRERGFQLTAVKSIEL